MNASTFALVISGVLLNTVAQFLLKAGAAAFSRIRATDTGWIEIFFTMAFNPWILGGLTLYVASFAIWIAVLAKMQVSLAYPLLSIGYVISIFAAYFIFGEPISMNKLIGVGLIIAGVTVLSRA